MKSPAWAGHLMRPFLGVGRLMALAMSDRRQLVAPDRGPDQRGIGDMRARLAGEPEVRVDRLLEALLIRARFRKGAARQQLLRSLPLLAPIRRQVVYIAQRASRFDDEFCAMIARADVARDKRDWAMGVEAYTQALSLYDDHAGYILQRSHCHKELRAYREAELGYRDALALGVPLDHALPHLDYVVQRRGGSVRLYPPGVMGMLEMPGSAAAHRAGMVTSRELRALAWLLLGQERPETDWLLAVMRDSPMRADAIERLLGEPAFFSANRALVGLAGRECGLS